MWVFVGITVALFLGLVFTQSSMNYKEVAANWSKYHNHPFYMFAAPMFKPDDDPRSRLQFATDNFHDVVSEMITKVFAILLQPLFKIFRLMIDALTQSLSSLFNIKSLLASMWDKWNKMTDVFQRRFNGVFHNFRVTFTKIFHSMEKSYSVAAASLFAGISTIHTMTSFLDLVIKIVISILVVLVVMVILLFFVLAPFIPLILTTIGIVAATAMGGAVGGMAESFCFTGDVLISTVNGPVRIDQIKIGQQLSATNNVTGVLHFIADKYDLYYLDGITVTGTHIVYHEDKPIHVKDHPNAVSIPKRREEIHCLITSEHIIPIVGTLDTYIFSDWEELEATDELQTWYETVYEALNGKPCDTKPSEDILFSEAGVLSGTTVATRYGPTCIESLCPGDMIFSADGEQTKVLGIVQLQPDAVKAAIQEGDTYISSGAWVEKEGSWDHPEGTPFKATTCWYNLFTASGTFKIETSEGTVNLRDFSDMGKDKIEDTYSMVLEMMEDRAFFQNEV